MRLTRDHAPWAAAVLLCTIAAVGAYFLHLAGAPYGPSGGSWYGLAFGIAGTACMVLATLLSLRKKLLLARIGSAQLWMKMHIWLGILAVPLILLHAGFRFGGALTTTLMLLFIVVIASGLFGLVAQHVVPRWMTAGVRLETVFGQIDHVLARLRLDAYEAAAAIAGPIAEAVEEQAALAREHELQSRVPGAWKEVVRQRPAQEPPPQAAMLRDLYVMQVRPYLRGEAAVRAYPIDLFAAAADLPEEWSATVQKLADCCEECRQLRLQRRLHHLLHGWLFVHAPLSLALLALAVLHAVYALRY